MQCLDQVFYLNTKLPLTGSMMAADGYHPSEKSYEARAQLIEPGVLDSL